MSGPTQGFNTPIRGGPGYLRAARIIDVGDGTVAPFRAQFEGTKLKDTIKILPLHLTLAGTTDRGGLLFGVKGRLAEHM